MGEADHCLSEFDCFTRPNSWFGGEGSTSGKTSHFHFLFFATSFWDKEIVKFVWNFSRNYFPKVSFAQS